MKKVILVLAFTVGLLSLSLPVSAQLINLKTAPIATGNQFLIHPQVNGGMGGVSIAVDDTLADPFVNPAKTTRIEGMQIYSLPNFYRIGNDYGRANTLAMGGLASGEQRFGGLGIAIQEMHQAEMAGNLLKNESANNNYLWIQGGSRLNEDISLGARASFSNLKAMGGVDLLYPGSRVSGQDGYRMDIRVGLDVKMVESVSLDLLVLFTRTDMTHEVRDLRFMDPWVDPVRVRGPTPRVEKNKDITNTWGLHAGYQQPVGDEGWRLGGVFTFNYKTHPKIPNYELMNIPRDPGDTWAFKLGVGSSHVSDDNVTFGVDLILEPIWSYTWAEAQQDIMNPEETRILVRKGEKTVENEFDFINTAVKTGLGWEGERALLSGGIRAKTYHYWLEQEDHVEQSIRKQEEYWTEWNFSLSTGYKFEGMKIQYSVWITTGTGRPGIATGGVFPTALRAESGDFIFAPEGALALDRATVTTHQLSVQLDL